MRVTIDVDNHNILCIGWRILLGTIICRKKPFKIRKTRRGYHIIWKGLNIDQNTMFKYRKWLHDDEKRLRLDMLSEKRIKQVLFTEKLVTYHGFMWHKGKSVNICPACERKIIKSVEDKENVHVYHYGTKPCVMCLT